MDAGEVCFAFNRRAECLYQIGHAFVRNTKLDGRLRDAHLTLKTYSINTRQGLQRTINRRTAAECGQFAPRVGLYMQLDMKSAAELENSNLEQAQNNAYGRFVPRQAERRLADNRYAEWGVWQTVVRQNMTFGKTEYVD